MIKEKRTNKTFYLTKSAHDKLIEVSKYLTKKFKRTVSTSIVVEIMTDTAYHSMKRRNRNAK